MKPAGFFLERCEAGNVELNTGEESPLLPETRISPDENSTQGALQKQIIRNQI